MKTLYQGNCLEVMPTLDANSIDTIITDPPYGLEFMGKGWDRGVPGVEFWVEALRVAKPGAMLLAFGGTRTHHRLMAAIEDAGWELRDCMMWLYGSGFPKSMDISKAIDKAAGAEREVIGIKPGHEEFATRTDAHSAGGRSDGWERPWRDDPERVAASHMLTAPATDLAKQWNGYGTAIKPAWEPIILAMKPIDGTFANNAKVHGVAGLNIDACRIASEGGSPAAKRRESARKSGNAPMQNRVLGVDKAAGANELGKIGRRGSADVYAAERDSEQLGRWPANVMFDEEAAALLDEQSGTLKSGSNCVRRQEGFFGEHGGLGKAGDLQTTYGDSGGASRFFYCAKASKSEKGADNIHPTVKPLKLMEYLCRLTATPTGGTVLDPFMGSGSTGVAAGNTGRDFVGIEMDEKYFPIAEKRVANVAA